MQIGDKVWVVRWQSTYTTTISAVDKSFIYVEGEASPFFKWSKHQKLFVDAGVLASSHEEAVEVLEAIRLDHLKKQISSRIHHLESLDVLLLIAPILELDVPELPDISGCRSGKDATR